VIAYRSNLRLVPTESDMIKEQIARLDRNLEHLAQIDKHLAEARRLHKSVQE
jgi:hypothetical protein